MAKVILGGAFADINGSIGGWTFQNTATGKIVRSKPAAIRSPIPHPYQSVGTPYSLVVDPRVLTPLIKKYWLGLSGAEQIAWTAFADANPYTDIYGNVKTLTGYQYFFHCISRQYIQGVVIQTTDPTGFPPADALEPFTLDFTGGALILDFGSAINHTDQYIWIFCTPPMQAFRQSNRRFYRLTHITFEPNATTFDITSYYDVKFGVDIAALDASSRIYISCYAFLTQRDTAFASVAEFSQYSNL